jgi:hypothetical protein
MTASSSDEPPVYSPGVPPLTSVGPDLSAGPREAGVAIEPTIGGAYSHAWTILKADFWTLLLIGFVAWLLGGAISGGFGRDAGAQSSIASLYHVFVGTPISFGAAYAWLRAVRGIKPQLTDLFVPFQRFYISAVLAGLLFQIAIGVGFILLIVPGFILLVRLSFVPFLVVDEGRGPVEALTESWNRTRGYGWTIFGAAMLGLLIIIVGLIVFIVGSIPATMLVYLAFASLYAAITARMPAAR